MDELVIETHGKKIHSPYYYRSEFYVNFNLSLKTIEELWRVFRDMYDDYENFNYGEYLDFCKYCGTEELCLRHKTAIQAAELIGMPSNHYYTYTFQFERKKDEFGDYVPDIVYFEFILGVSNWRIAGDKQKIIVVRPSGKTFTYNNHGSKSTYRYFISKIADFLERILEHSTWRFKESDC